LISVRQRKDIKIFLWVGSCRFQAEFGRNTQISTEFNPGSGFIQAGGETELMSLKASDCVWSSDLI